MKKAKLSKTPSAGASDITHIALVFDNNQLIRELFGQFDQNLALIERELNISATARGNELELRGSKHATGLARLVFDHLYSRLEKGEALSSGDIEGVLRMAQTPNGLASSGSAERNGKLALVALSTTKKTIVARSANQDAYIRAMMRSEMVFGVGPAGTGKTYLAVAYAASLLEQGTIERIILSRPAVEAGEQLGFLPGDMKDKVDPYLRPLYDALYDMMPGDKVERALAQGTIEIAPLAFMRGRTLANAVIILDEAQNTTPMQMKMFLTRLGENSKIIITGDPSQSDLPGRQMSGLNQALELLQKVDGIVQVRFTSSDIVRHRLVTAIVEAYDKAPDRPKISGRQNP